MSIEDRYPMEADVTTAMGKRGVVRVGVEPGVIRTLTPPGDGYSMTPTQCRELIDMYQRALRIEHFHSRHES